MPNERRRRIATGIIALVVLQSAAIALYFAVQRDRSGPADPTFRVEKLPGGSLAPNIVLERSDGSRTTVHDLGDGVRLVHFWATWCPPCVEELPGLLATSRQLAGQGLTLIAISMDEDWGQIRTFFEGDVPNEVFRAVDREAHRQYDVKSLPDTYLLGPSGRPLLRYGGARAWVGAPAQLHLRQLVTGKAEP